MPSSLDIVTEAPEAGGLLPVPVEHLPDWWQAILSPLSRLLERRSEYRPSDIYEALLDHRMQLWVGYDDSFVITQVGEYPTTKVLMILFAGGALETIRRHMGDLEAWARERGCNRLRVHGRAGWERVFHMKRLGIVLEREL